MPPPSPPLSQEWDATVLELHQLRTSLHKTRQELSHALYQHDAATRVIARLLQERDGYRAAAEAAAATRAAAPADANGKRGAEADGGEDGGEAKKAKGGVTARVVEALTAASDELSRGRKKRVVPPSTATPEEVGRLALAHTLPLHKTRKGGILAIDLAPGSGDLAATAGADGCVQVYDVAGARSVAELAGHSKRVNDVRFLGSADLLASASADRTVRLWRRGEAEGDYAAAATLADQAGEVVALVVHPSNDYLVAAAADGTWAFYDVAQALCLTKVADEGAAYSAAALHPDGLILSTGTEGAAVKIWETRTQKVQCWRFVGWGPGSGIGCAGWGPEGGQGGKHDDAIPGAAWGLSRVERGWMRSDCCCGAERLMRRCAAGSHWGPRGQTPG